MPSKEKEEKYEKLARLDLALRFQEKPVSFRKFFELIERFFNLIKS